ncbi:transglycosylase domain-containing protein [Nocardioides flavescens]|nr:transglycosylase domain-containing protein [Nocardioides flavescens]
MPPQERLPAYRVLTHLGLMVAVSAVLGLVVAGLAVPFAGVAGLGARNVSKGMADLPEELETQPLSQRTTILDADGNRIASLYDENRVTVPLKGISRTMVKALVAIEDYRFYQHGALDLKGTLRALITNQASDGVVQGGSSITQQLVKLTLQSQAKTPEELKAATADTYARKLKELRYAIALEQTHSKDWILERYLNTAYFGDGAYGIQSAARHYFDVNARDLNVRQSAVLAGLVKNPTGYDPTNYPDRAIERRNVVLDRMAQLNVIPREKADKAKEKDLGLKVTETSSGCLNSTAPFFCDFVVEYLLDDESLGKTRDERENLLKTGGLTIQTTLSMSDQQAADAGVQNHVQQSDPAIGALAIVQPGTGNVVALAQSRPMGVNPKKNETFVNYTIPREYGGSNGFQPGSTFKAFTLAAALDMGMPLSTAYNAPSPMTFDQADFANCPGQPGFVGPYPVSNSTSTPTGSYMNMYGGTRYSINTYFLQLEEATGVCKPFELAKAMGVRLTDPAVERFPSFTLGVTDASPLEMAEAYATFAARGLHCDSRPVTQIKDANGTVLKDYASNCQQVMQQTTADAVNDVLRGVIEGGFADAQRLSVPAAGKTGTTSAQKAVWFAGYTTKYAAAATIAGITPAGVPDELPGKTISGSYIYEASGSGFAAPIWGDALKAITAGDPYEDFVPPTTAGAGDTVPYVPPAPNNGGRGGDGRGPRGPRGR